MFDWLEIVHSFMNFFEHALDFLACDFCEDLVLVESLCRKQITILSQVLIITVITWYMNMMIVVMSH